MRNASPILANFDLWKMIGRILQLDPSAPAPSTSVGGTVGPMLRVMTCRVTFGMPDRVIEYQELLRKELQALIVSQGGELDGGGGGGGQDDFHFSQGYVLKGERDGDIMGGFEVFFVNLGGGRGTFIVTASEMVGDATQWMDKAAGRSAAERAKLQAQWVARTPAPQKRAELAAKAASQPSSPATQPK